MNRLTFSAILAVLGILISSTVFSAPEPKDGARAEIEEELAALRKERRDVLREASRRAEDMYKQGDNIYQLVAQVLTNWRDSELDLAPDRPARIKLRKRMLERCKNLEAVAVDQARRRQQGEGDMLEAKADRLQAEIDLLREQLTD